MYVGCHDCGKKLEGKGFDRPRNAKTGMKNTVEVCERCLVLWQLKQAKKAETAFNQGSWSDSKPVMKGINSAIKFLEGKTWRNSR